MTGGLGHLYSVMMIDSNANTVTDVPLLSFTSSRVCIVDLIFLTVLRRKTVAHKVHIKLQSLYPRPNWDPQPPLPQASVSPQTIGGGAHSPAGEGAGVPIRTTGEKISSFMLIL
jgi:hypothetical protein